MTMKTDRMISDLKDLANQLEECSAQLDIDPALSRRVENSIDSLGELIQEVEDDNSERIREEEEADDEDDEEETEGG